MYEGPHETFLNDILGILNIPRDPQRETEDLAVVSFINLAKCWQAFRPDPVGHTLRRHLAQNRCRLRRLGDSLLCGERFRKALLKLPILRLRQKQVSELLLPIESNDLCS